MGWECAVSFDAGDFLFFCSSERLGHFLKGIWVREFFEVCSCVQIYFVLIFWMTSLIFLSETFFIPYLVNVGYISFKKHPFSLKFYQEPTFYPFILPVKTFFTLNSLQKSLFHPRFPAESSFHHKFQQKSSNSHI